VSNEKTKHISEFVSAVVRNPSPTVPLENQIVKTSDIQQAWMKAIEDAIFNAARPKHTTDGAEQLAQAICDQVGATLEPGSVRVDGDGHAITYSAKLPGKIQRADGAAQCFINGQEVSVPVIREGDEIWATPVKDGWVSVNVERPCPPAGMSAESTPKELRKLYAEPVEQAWEEIDLGSAQPATGSTTRTPCPDCAHTEHPGQYWGAFEASPCSTCGGTCEVAR